MFVVAKIHFYDWHIFRIKVFKKFFLVKKLVKIMVAFKKINILNKQIKLLNFLLLSSDILTNQY